MIVPRTKELPKPNKEAMCNVCISHGRGEVPSLTHNLKRAFLFVLRLNVSHRNGAFIVNVPRVVEFITRFHCCSLLMCMWIHILHSSKKQKFFLKNAANYKYKNRANEILC